MGQILPRTSPFQPKLPLQYTHRFKCVPLLPPPILILLREIAFDETESYTSNNDVFTVLLGDAVPASKQGTTDNTAYTHYSIMATVENNWDLGNLGLGDQGATPFY